MADYASTDKSSEDRDGLFRRLKKLYRVDREFSAKWRTEAKDDFDFVAGEQTSEDDKEHLKKQMRPLIQMNLTLRNVNAVSGQEMSNRQEVRYIPREEGDVKPNELLTEAARWFRDCASGDDEDSEAFVHMITCGMGWTDTTLDFDEDEAGTPDMGAVNPLEMLWDRNARKNNITDGERVWRVRRRPRVKAKEMFPDADPAELDAAWARPEGDEGETKDQDRERLYQDDGSAEDADDDDQVTIVHCQYVVKQPYYDVITPLSGTKQEMSEADYKKFAKRAGELGLPLKAAKKMKRVIRDCWLGGVVLQSNDALCQAKFRYQCITGYRDETKGTFYGIVRAMKDPQRWANKLFMQTHDIMNSNAKGGLLAERGVTDNPRQFEKDYARGDRITWVDDGSLQGPNGPRVVPKEMGQFPQGFYQLMTSAFDMIQQVPGISQEMLGQQDNDQAAMLDHQRKQAGMTILQPLFKNLKRYRKEQGSVVLYIIQHRLSDETLIRILGNEEKKYVTAGALRANVTSAKFDIIVDDSPTSPNQKELTWAMILQTMPLIADKVSAETLLAFLEYSPLPSKIVEQMKKKAADDAQSPMAQLQQQVAQINARLDQAKVGLTLAQTQLAGAQAEKAMADAGQNPGTEPYAELALEHIKEQGKLILQHNKQVADANLQASKTAGELQVATVRHNSDVQMAAEKHVVDLAKQHNAIEMNTLKTVAGIHTDAFKAQEAAKIAAKKPAPRAS